MNEIDKIAWVVWTLLGVNTALVIVLFAMLFDIARQRRRLAETSANG